MEMHNIPNDSYNHIESFACGCNPTVVVSEGEESYIHNEIKYKYWSDFPYCKSYPKLIVTDEQNSDK